jgi:outer membrane protein assembly factor BamB
LLSIALCGQAATDWPRFRGPNGTGVSDATELPVELGPERSMLWKLAVPGGHSSPVVSGNRLFLTAFEGGKLLVLAVDARSGRELWRREAPRSRTTKSPGANTPASPTPVTDGSNVYVFFEDFGLLSYGPDGKERWRLPLGPFYNPYGMAVSPILAGGNVVLQADQDTGSYLLAAGKDDGRERWKVERPEATHGFSSPVTYKDEIIVSGAYQLAGYSASDGRKLWWVNGMAWQAKSVPVVAGDRLYVHSWMAAPSELGLKAAPPFERTLKEHDRDQDGRISRDEAPDPEMKKLWFLFDLDKDGAMNEREWNVHRSRGTAGSGLFAVKLGGRGDLTADGMLWRFTRSLPNIPSPLFYRDVLYVLREGGILTSLNPVDGSVLKQGRIEGALDPYYASPVAADGKIYTVSQNGKVAVLKAGAQWELLSVNDLAEECWATPAIAGGRVYIRTKTTLFCFGNRG